MQGRVREMIGSKIHDMSRYLSIWFQFAKTSWISEMEFRANFALRIITDFFWYATQIVSFEVILGHVGNIGGWTAPHMRVFLAILFLVDALYMMMFHDNLEYVGRKVRTGYLDLILAKPIDSQFMISSEKLGPSYVFNFLSSLGFLFWGLSSLPDYAWWKVFLLIWLIPAALAITYSVRFFFVSLTVAFVGVDGVMYLWYSFYRLAMRPDTIYFPWIRFVLLSVIPVAFIASVPARILLEDFDPLLLIGSVIVPIFVFWLSRRTWKYALRFYNSASS